MKPLPMEWRFALWSVAVTCVAVVIFGTTTLLNLNHEQLKSVDEEMTSEAAMLNRRAQLPLDAQRPVGIDFHPWMAYGVFGPDGRVENLSSRLDEAAAREATRRTQPFTRRSGRGEWRLRGYPGEGGRVVVVGYNLEEIHELVRDLLISYTVSLPFVLLAAALGGRWVARRALRPIRALAGEITTIVPERLHIRVTEPKAEDELRLLARTFNVMLARLDASFQQTQRFAADASHELRTPLTIMQSEIGQLLRSPMNGPVTEERLLSLQEEAGRLDRITEHLLLLARFDAGRIQPPHARVDLSALVRESAEDAELIAETMDVSLGCDAADGVQVEGDALMLRRLVLNLLDNAVRHNERGGRAECRLAREDGRVLLRVRNTGPGVPPAARASLFQRFFRADPARSRGGHGLGLALCREIARSHGGDVRYEVSEPGWTDFVLELPAAK